MPHTLPRLCRRREGRPLSWVSGRSGTGRYSLRSPSAHAVAGERSDLPPLMDTSLTRRRVLQGTLGGAAGLVAWHQGWPRLQSAAAQKDTLSGRMTWAIHVTLAPTWLDPSETLALATPYMLLYAVHDALLKPMPDNSMSPSLAT